MTMAIPVTSSVPIIKDKKPNSPLRGDHDEEKSRCKIDSLARIGLDFINKPKAMRKTIKFAKATAKSIDLPAKLSFIRLQCIITCPPPVLFRIQMSGARIQNRRLANLMSCSTSQKAGIVFLFCFLTLGFWILTIYSFTFRSASSICAFVNLIYPISSTYFWPSVKTHRINSRARPLNLSFVRR